MASRSGPLAATLFGGVRAGSLRVHDPCKDHAHGSCLGFPGRRQPRGPAAPGNVARDLQVLLPGKNHPAPRRAAGRRNLHVARLGTDPVLALSRRASVHDRRPSDPRHDTCKSPSNIENMHTAAVFSFRQGRDGSQFQGGPVAYCRASPCESSLEGLFALGNGRAPQVVRRSGGPNS